MKKTYLIAALAIIGMLLTLNVGQAHAVVLDTTCYYNLFYYDAGWVKVHPNDTPVYNSSTIWKYSYILENKSTSTADIVWWHVFYDDTHMSSVTQTGIPTGWDKNSGGFQTGVFTDPSYLVQWVSQNNLVYKIAPGSSMIGFEYTFNWSGEDIPGSQHYQVGSRYSSQSSDTIPTPEPASAVLLGVGLVGLAGRFIRNKFKQ